ncbi:hypothetical protein pdam_00025623, partial [Pocillopora damicornis]
MLQELERNVPCLVLMCAEEQNWFTFLQTCLKKQFMNIVTITEDDDACSAYGINKGERHQDILDTLDRVVVFLEEHGQDQGD